MLLIFSDINLVKNWRDPNQFSSQDRIETRNGMKPQPNAYWKHEPWYVKTPQSAMDGLIDKSRIWMPRKSNKFKKFA